MLERKLGRVCFPAPARRGCEDSPECRCEASIALVTSANLRGVASTPAVPPALRVLGFPLYCLHVKKPVGARPPPPVKVVGGLAIRTWSTDFSGWRSPEGPGSPDTHSQFHALLGNEVRVLEPLLKYPGERGQSFYRNLLVKPAVTDRFLHA